MFAKDEPLSVSTCGRPRCGPNSASTFNREELILNFLRKLIKLELIVKANDPDHGDKLSGTYAYR